MKILQVGLGSMGKRRIRNLLTLGASRENIIGVDIHPTRRSEAEAFFSIKTYEDFRQASKKENPDVYIISTPPDMHAPFFLHAAKKGKHFFVEIGTTDRGYDRLLTVLQNTRIVAAPSCTYRFYSPIQKIHQLIRKGDIGKIYSFTHHMGQYLPDWHPFEDYRLFYAAKKRGALYEMLVFELQWLSWILGGEFLKGFLKNYKCSPLEIEGPDLTMVLLEGASRERGMVILDLISKPAIRSLRLIGERGTIEWDWRGKRVRLFSDSKNRWKTFRFLDEKKVGTYLADERMYEEELKSFLLAIKGKQAFPNTFEEDRRHIHFIQRLYRRQMAR